MELKDYLNRSDRPLPKRGCSVAFYLFLLALILILVFSYFKYQRL